MNIKKVALSNNAFSLLCASVLFAAPATANADQWTGTEVLVSSPWTERSFEAPVHGKRPYRQQGDSLKWEASESQACIAAGSTQGGRCLVERSFELPVTECDERFSLSVHYTALGSNSGTGRDNDFVLGVGSPTTMLSGAHTDAGTVIHAIDFRDAAAPFAQSFNTLELIPTSNSIGDEVEVTLEVTQVGTAWQLEFTGRDATDDSPLFAISATHPALAPEDLSLYLASGDRHEEFIVHSVEVLGCEHHDSNTPPVALCVEDLVIEADSLTCEACVQIDDGSFDPDDDAINIAQSPDCNYGLGTQVVTLEVVDEHGAHDQCQTTVTVQDTSEPAIDPQNATDLKVCSIGPSEVALMLPIVFDGCDSAPQLTGEIVARGGTPLVPTVEVPPTGVISLTPGSYTVEWTAIDSSGNSSTVQELVSITADSSMAACCDLATADRVIEGSHISDGIYHSAATDDLVVLGGAGQDVITTGSGKDCILAGDDADNVSSVGGDDRVFGGRGDDVIEGCQWSPLVSGQLSANGGEGDDNISARGCHAATLFGGAGNDVIVGSWEGDDVLVPGAGADIVEGHAGDDTIVIYDACEIVSGELIDGGDGEDTLYSPVSANQLLLMGVTVIDVEHIVVTTENQHLADCF